MERFWIPAGVEDACSVLVSFHQQDIIGYFPKDEITELLTSYGHNRCENGFVINARDNLCKPRESFNGKWVVITGYFENLTRMEIAFMILIRGGRVNEFITKNTSYIVVGSDAGAKLKKIRKSRCSPFNDTRIF